MLLLIRVYRRRLYCHLCIFTFHYASTYTRRNCCRALIHTIYIPLCFYLYAAVPLNRKFCQHLHSTMLLLIRHIETGHNLEYPHLHSTMLLLIPLSELFNDQYIKHLHSTMLLLILKTFRRLNRSA